MRDAGRLRDDYFTLERQAFVERWLPRSAAALRRQTTPESWRMIVETLGNADQTRIVADDREQTSVLVLAGPGSGKTRVLVHRIAILSVSGGRTRKASWRWSTTATPQRKSGAGSSIFSGRMRAA